MLSLSISLSLSEIHSVTAGFVLSQSVMHQNVYIRHDHRQPANQSTQQQQNKRCAHVCVFIIGRWLWAHNEIKRGNGQGGPLRTTRKKKDDNDERLLKTKRRILTN